MKVLDNPGVKNDLAILAVSFSFIFFYFLARAILQNDAKESEQVLIENGD